MMDERIDVQEWENEGEQETACRAKEKKVTHSQ